MRIIPVLDLMDGQVVRGVAGRRSEYRPIVSRLSPSADPLAVAGAFRRRLGLRELYLADLDALAGAPPALDIYRALRSEGFQLWVDAGIRQAGDSQPLVEMKIERIVAGLETLAGPQVLEELCRSQGRRIVFSLDLKDGEVFAGSDGWSSEMPLDVARQAIDLGVTSILVLDLRRVGTGGGTGTEALCRRVAESFPHVELSAGGGIRGPDDLQRLQGCGVQAALVASALHDGRIELRIEN